MVTIGGKGGRTGEIIRHADGAWPSSVYSIVIPQDAIEDNSATRRKCNAGSRMVGHDGVGHSDAAVGHSIDPIADAAAVVVNSSMHETRRCPFDGQACAPGIGGRSAKVAVQDGVGHRGRAGGAHVYPATLTIGYLAGFVLIHDVIAQDRITPLHVQPAAYTLVHCAGSVISDDVADQGSITP